MMYAGRARRSAGDEDDEVEYVDVMMGEAGALIHDHDGDPAATFLYVPDMSQQTGWSTYRVQRNGQQRGHEREVGFKMRGKS